jgi:hypothetical protein
MIELEIIINKILKDWLQSKGEGDIVFTDDIAINEVTDEIVSECHKEYDELLRQRDELKEVLKQIMFSSGTLKTVQDIAEASIKSTESI